MIAAHEKIPPEKEIAAWTGVSFADSCAQHINNLLI